MVTGICHRHVIEHSCLASRYTLLGSLELPDQSTEIGKSLAPLVRVSVSDKAQEHNTFT